MTIDNYKEFYSMSPDQSQTPASTQQQIPPKVVEPVPGVWPGAFGLYKHSKAAVMYNIATFLGLIGFSILVSVASSFVTGDRSISLDGGNSFQMSGAGTIVNVIVQLVGIWLSAAIAYALVVSIKRQKLSVSESLREGGAIFLPFLGLNLLLGLITVASILLFVIPVFFVLPRLMLAQFFLIEGKLGVMESISASWNATKGNVGKVWGIFGVNVLFGLLFLTFIGIPFALYFAVMYQAAIPILYMYLRTAKNNSVPIQSAAASGPTPPSAE